MFPQVIINMDILGDVGEDKEKDMECRKEGRGELRF